MRLCKLESHPRYYALLNPEPSALLVFWFVVDLIYVSAIGLWVDFIVLDLTGYSYYLLRMLECWWFWSGNKQIPGWTKSQKTGGT